MTTPVNLRGGDERGVEELCPETERRLIDGCHRYCDILSIMTGRDMWFDLVRFLTRNKNKTFVPVGVVAFREVL